ncbi:MAG: hypothetical protein U0807_15415 [Candidatus Binatia bacterium]
MMAILALAESSPEAVFEFLETRMSARGRAHWRWKFQLGRDRDGRAFFHQAPDGRVTGFIGLLPTALHAPGRVVRATWFVDWATGEGGVGAGVGLLRRAQATTDILLTLGGSPDTVAILPRLKWQRIDAPGMWILPVSGRTVAARAAGRSVVLRFPSRLVGALARWYFRPSRPPAGRFSLREVDRFPESYDAVWNARCAEFAPLMDRSSAQLNFMFADYPEGGYRRFLVLDRGAVVGHVVLRVDHHRGQARGRIVDLLWPRAQAELVEWVVREATWRLAQASADTVECTASVPELERALAAVRFSNRWPVRIWYDRLPEGVTPPQTWFITFLDCDRAYR